MNPNDDLRDIKEAYRIPDAWRDLGLSGKLGKSCRCPWREDRKPSFSVFDDGRMFKDFATGETGNVFQFVALATGWEIRDAIGWVKERAGIGCFDPPPPRSRREAKEPERPALVLPPLTDGTPEDWRQVAKIRRLRPYAAEVAASLGILRFGEVCGFPCWVLVEEGRIAEARRLDGKPSPALGPLGERKAHTLRGSRKSWPLGASLLAESPEAAVLLVEGGPDWLAALHFLANEQRKGCVPVAMLGRTTSISAEALPLFEGRRIRFYPHADQDGGGRQAARKWTAQLASAGAGRIDAFDFSGLFRRDGRPVSDLNDCTVIRPEDKPELSELLP